MAQAVFEEHPLEQYLRDAGELHDELMPGSSSELVQELDIDSYDELLEDDQEMEWRPHCLIVGLNALESFLASARPSTPRNPFVERFKYHVISSSLLSSSSLPNPTPRSSISVPGRLTHSRSSSVSLEHPLQTDPTAVFAYSSSNHYGLLSLAALATALFAGAGNRLLATVSLGGLSFVLYHLLTTSTSPSHDFTPTFTALDDLLAANASWESIVHDAVQTVETDESSHSLRVALLSTLQTTRTQCDNVRQLFGALTCPAELAQLSEMYGPPTASPVKSPLALGNQDRPWSFPSRRDPTTPQNKRSTWHPATQSVAGSSNPKRRSHVDTSTSAPPTPSPLSQLPQPYSEGTQQDNGDAFGPAALGLHRSTVHATLSPPPERHRTPRSRRLSGATTHSPSMHSTSTPNTLSRHSTMPSHTHLQPLSLRHTHHSLSLFTLNQAYQSAVAAKRYTCSHLLALRFTEDEEEYWENVRSMMELLTSTFVDEAMRLGEALEERERERVRDGNVTPVGDLKRDDFEWADKGKAKDVFRGFAPLPSHLSRFAAHVAAITSALEDARENLQECVDALKADAAPSPPSSVSSSSSKSMSSGEAEHKAILAYERLRKELGMALRECERGKQRLVDICHPPPVPSSDEEEDDVPGLGHDVSDDSDKAEADIDPASPSEDEGEAMLVGNAAEEGDDTGLGVDDVAAHLLREMSIHQGIEQVYEADTSNVVPFTRERSKMTREERIKAVKARREAASSSAGVTMTGSSGDGLGIFNGGAEGGKMEKWGPGGEVVQELKDVIWKVGERRRKIQEMHILQQQKEAAAAELLRTSVTTAERPEGGQEEKVYDLKFPESVERTCSPSLPDSPSPKSPVRLAFDGEDLRTFGCSPGELFESSSPF